MVSKLREMDAIRSAPVAAALDVVPRHLFAPGEPLEAAYAPEGIVMAKRGPDGLPLSVMSAAHLQAVMLEQAGIEPGMRVLEVGSGGYNAALIQEITGDSGQVTTAEALGQALDSPGLECWSGAAWDLPDELELFLTASLPQVGRVHASQAAIDKGIIAQSALMGVTALTAIDSFAYRVKRTNEATGGYESGVIAHGPQGASLARQYADVLRQWVRDYYRRGAAVFRYLPRNAAPALIPLPHGRDSQAARRGHHLLALDRAVDLQDARAAGPGSPARTGAQRHASGLLSMIATDLAGAL